MFIRPIAYYEPGGATGTAEPPAAVPPPAEAASPTPAPATPDRDPQTGRFTAAKIREAAGLPPEGEGVPVVAPVVPAKAAEPAKVEASTLDADLENLDKIIGTEPVAETPVAPAAPAPPPQAPIAATPELQQIQQWLANPEVGKAAYESARNWVVLNNSLSRGDIEGFLGTFDPAVQQALVNHIWQKNRETLIQQYTDEQNGVRRDPEVDMLKRQLNDLSNFIRNQQQQQTQTQQQQQQAQAQRELTGKFHAYAESLFTAVGLKDSPYRVYLESAVKNKVFSDPKMAANIQAGRFGDYGRAFRELYPQFRTQLLSVSQPPQPAAQPASAQLMTAASGTPSGQAPAENDLVTADNRLSGKGIVRRLKDYMKNVS